MNTKLFCSVVIVLALSIANYGTAVHAQTENSVSNQNYECEEWNNSWRCFVDVPSAPPGCSLGSRGFGEKFITCESLPDESCRSFGGETAACGPAQKATHEGILRAITNNIPAGNVVCAEDPTYPGRTVVYCTPQINAAGCTPFSSPTGSYSICTDYPIDSSRCFQETLGGFSGSSCPLSAIENTESETTTNTPAERLGYSPLEPLPGLDPNNLNLRQLLQAIFDILITIGALFAVVMLVIGGISYMTSEAFDTKNEAKKRMQAAVWGLVLLAGSWLILYTINPQLLNFDLSINGQGGSGSSNTQSGNLQNAEELERATDECRRLGRNIGECL